jgi:type IV secretion system protein VirD4
VYAPGPEKDAQGRVIKPGDMLIFTAGQSPIYGRQILYFFDPVFSVRSKMPAPDRSDSLYAPKPVAAEKPAAPAPEKENYESYFSE